MALRKAVCDTTSVHHNVLAHSRAPKTLAVAGRYKNISISQRMWLYRIGLSANPCPSDSVDRNPARMLFVEKFFRTIVTRQGQRHIKAYVLQLRCS